MRAKWILAVVVAVIVLATAGFIAYAWYPALAATDKPQASAFDPALIARGGELALIGNCITCHTQDGGTPYAGARPVPTPFGTIYSTNITPDLETGLGGWSEAAFSRALREGVHRDGRHLYPAFPYDHFTRLTDDDVRALYAFLMTRGPVHADPPANDLIFPFNMRILIAAWKLLFFERGEFRPDTAQPAEWNHGAYLVEALAHCGACHTPRNLLGAERRDQHFSGGDIEGWHAPALNEQSPAPTPWSTDQLITYLRNGFVEPHGVAAGPMQPVVNSLGRVPTEDVKAIATYVGSTLGPATADRKGKAEQIRERIESDSLATVGASAETTGRGGPAPASGASSDAAKATGSTIYLGACASCHERSGQRFSAHGIHLAYSSFLTMPDPHNLIHVIRHGIEPPDRAPGALMPGFAHAFTDQQTAALLNHLRSTFTNRSEWTDVEGSIRKVHEAETR
jgi:mono/diheme cytochrome c family protein